MSASALRIARPARRILVALVLFLGLLLGSFAGAGIATAAPAHHHSHTHTAHHHKHHQHHGCKHHKHRGCKHHKHGRKHHGRTHHGRKHHNTTNGNRTISTTRHGAPATGSTEAERKIANALLSMLNRERVANHRGALHMNGELLVSARRHNLAMARTDLMSHQVSGEADLGTRESDAGYNWSWAGENIGWNSRMDQEGVLQLETMMFNEQAPNDGHRQNILNSNFKDIGVDVYFDNSNNKVWLTTDFGRHM